MMSSLCKLTLYLSSNLYSPTPKGPPKPGEGILELTISYNHPQTYIATEDKLGSCAKSDRLILFFDSF